MRFHEHYNGWIVWESMKKSKHVTEVQQKSLVRFYAYMNK